MKRVVLGVGSVTVALGFALLASPGSSVAENAVESSQELAAASGYDELAELASRTQRPKEGRPTGILSGKSDSALRVRGATVSKKLRRQAGKALRSSKIVKGRHPKGSMPRDPYIPQTACYANELPGVAAFRDMLLRTFPRPAETLQMYNINRGCNTPGISEHEEGRALDFEAEVTDPVQYAQAKKLLRYLTKRNGYHARRWGIMYIIYNKQLWAQYKPYWRQMSDRGNRVDNHMDHIHFTFTWNGSVQKSSYWTGKVRRVDRGPCVKVRSHFAPLQLKKRVNKPRRKSCRSPRSIGRDWRYSSSVMYWQGGERVEWLQQYLSENGGHYQGPVDGAFGRGTFAAVESWQRANRVPRTGVWDPISQHTSQRVVMKRQPTVVTGWPTVPSSVVAGQIVPFSVAVTTDGSRTRTVSLQQRPSGSSVPWTTVATGTTDADGNFTGAVNWLPGSWKYRLVVASTSALAEAETRSWKVTGTAATPTPVVTPPPASAPTPPPAPTLTPTPEPTPTETVEPPETETPTPTASPTSE